MLRSHLVPLVAVIFAAAIFQVSNGALGTLLPVRLGLAAAGELATGLIATAYAGGFVVGCRDRRPGDPHASATSAPSPRSPRPPRSPR